MAACGTLRPAAPQGYDCAGAPEIPAATRNAVTRTQAVLLALRGCDRVVVARRYGSTPEELDGWIRAFVAGGRTNLMQSDTSTPAELQEAWRGTWVLRSRLGPAGAKARAEGVMIYEDAESLTVETGILSDEFAELPLGTQSGKHFRLGQYSRLQYLRRSESKYVVRMSSSELVGSYSDFPRGIHASLVEPFSRRGQAFLHEPAPLRNYSPDASDYTLVLGDTLLIGWSNLDVFDTWERVRRDTPELGPVRTLREAWERLKASRALLDAAPANPAELMGARLYASARVAAPARSR